MKLDFTKMHGCGNDYIFIDCFDLEIKSPESLSVLLSDRHKGVGGDGLVLIMRSDTTDAKMRMFNIDGSEAGMCGNAVRCVAKYLFENGAARKNRLRIETRSGVKELLPYVENDTVTSVTVNMGRAELRPEKIPVDLPGESVISKPVTVGGEEYIITCVSLGNPHAVVFCRDTDKLDLRGIGPLFENDRLFPERVNAEFAELVGKNRLKARVWERGSGETQACGTGACACAAAAVLNGYCDKDKDIEVLLPGGELMVRCTDEAVFLTGDCVKVFEGTIEV
ncbi:MAG: diaminopimelate epimerase [Oscillospiraceae bacterium]|nr:diaminopimelate epimerase [Oscillospiraceae bacterium]